MKVHLNHFFSFSTLKQCFVWDGRAWKILYGSLQGYLLSRQIFQASGCYNLPEWFEFNVLGKDQATFFSSTNFALGSAVSQIRLNLMHLKFEVQNPWRNKMSLEQKMQVLLAILLISFITKTALKCSGYVIAIKITWGVKKHRPNILHLITDQLVKSPVAFTL